MASLLKSSVNVTAPRGAGVSRRASVRPVVLSRATTEQETTTSASAYEIPDPNKADGFVAKDTAGQVNMFPTVMRPFEAGSSADTDKSGEDGTRVAALVGGGVAAALVAAGLLALTLGSGQPTETQAGEYLSLTSYQTKFAAELGINTSPAVVAMSPDVVVLAPTPAPAVEAAEVPAEEVPALTE